MQVTEAIILAGGLGTRLRSAVPDLPKCMAPVNGRPFISYVTNHLRGQGITRFVFSLGYRSEAFLDFLSQQFSAGEYEAVIEEEPLGTGGAIRYACGFVASPHVLALNGDSIFKADLRQLALLHEAKQADCTLALKPMQRFDRYGVVRINDDHRIVSFEEKRFYESGYINGGMYILDRNVFLSESLPEKCSFETDYLQAYYSRRKFYGCPQDTYFIDIGVPDDYARAQKEL